MFVPCISAPDFKPASFKSTTLVMPTHCVGLNAFIGVDLFILNEGAQKVGYFKSKAIAPGVSNDGLTLASDTPGQLICPCEIFYSETHKKTFFVMRSGVIGSRKRQFHDELVKFITDSGFSDVVILTSTLNPVRKERESNRNLPEFFGYVNNFLYK